MIVPPLLTLIMTGALFWVIANQTVIHTLLDKTTGKDASASTGTGTNTASSGNPLGAEGKPSLATLLSQDKLEDAKVILDAKKKDGSIDDEGKETLDKICVKLARKEAKAKHYKQALALLDQVSDKTDEEVKLLVKKYRRLSK
jgi:hypothetical protein